MREQLFFCNSADELITFCLKFNRNRPLSVRELSRRLKYNSDRTVGMVLTKKRPMSLEMLGRISNFIGFTDRENTFSMLLLQREKLKRQQKRTEVAALESKLSGFRKSLPSYRDVSSDLLSQMEQWFYFPLLRLIKTSPDGISYKNIYNAFDKIISQHDLKKALDILVSMSEIKQIENDKYSSVDKRYIKTSIDVPSATVQRAHKSQLERAISALADQGVLDREYISKTLVISKSKLKKFKLRLRELLEQVSDELIAVDGANDLAIYQLSLQFYKQADLT